jgi:hypothetical protein
MRAQRARRAGERGARMAVGAAVALTTASMLALCLPVDALEASDVGALSGTLKRVKQVGTIMLGYRESSLPFSYVNRLRQPIGYPRTCYQRRDGHRQLLVFLPGARSLPRLGSLVGFGHARILFVTNDPSARGVPQAAQRLLSFLRLVAELGAKEGVFLQSTDMMAR